jgi:hypothetical protein
MRKTLTVRHLILWVGLSAMACGALFAAHSDWTWALFAAYPLCLLARWGRPMARWCPVVFTLAVVALSAGGARPGADLIIVGFISLFLLAISPLLALPKDSHRTGGYHRLALLVAATSLLTMVSIVATRWPLRLTFLASRSEFDAFATRLEAGYRMTEPERVGRFLILKAEMREGRPCLWLDIDPAGYDGFVRNPRRGPDGKLLGPSNLCFNLWWDVPLDDDWAFISED